MSSTTALFHLPGLFEFYDLYKVFLPLFRENRNWFYEWCRIGSIYGSPADCIWGGGRAGYGQNHIENEVLALCHEYNISARLTFSNSLLEEKHLSDKKCNNLCSLFQHKSISHPETPNGIIICSDILLTYIKKNYPDFYFVSSTTKVLKNFSDFRNELFREDFSFVVPDFRLNKAFDQLNSLPQDLKNKTEFLINECCWTGCTQRKKCYENVSRKNLRLPYTDISCTAPDSKDGYVFSKAMKNESFISLQDIKETYLPMGFSNFKIEGRSLGSALILEFLLYYMTKPEFQLNVREAVYLNNSLDLF